MKKKLPISLFLCGVLLAFSCKNDANTTDETEETTVINYDNMAEDLCKCMTPLMEIQQKIAILSAENKTDEIQKLLDTVQKISDDGDKCVAAMEAKYGSVENEDEEKANAAFQKACPEIAEMLNDAPE